MVAGNSESRVVLNLVQIDDSLIETIPIKQTLV
jgi:hypothetical protein